MIPAPKLVNEAERIASLEKMRLLSTPREADIDRITRMAERFFKTEIALVSLVDKDRQWFKSRRGLNETETPRDISFCGHAIQAEETFVVNDALSDERFHDNPLVTKGPQMRFYAGHPLKNHDGYRIGTLCVISPQPRPFTDGEKTTLQDLARMVEVILESRKLSESQIALLDRLAAAERDKLIDPLSGLWNRRGLDELFKREVARSIRAKTSLVVGIVDIDHFKKVNDTFGHAVGDEAIKLTAELLMQEVRATDIVARIGGEEFALVAPNVESAMVPVLGQKILRSFRSSAKVKTGDGSYPFTVSIGFTLAQPTRQFEGLEESMLDAADKALYKAKNAGRDRVEMATVAAGP